jgi:hypothetical protein
MPPHCHLRLSGSTICRHYFINDTIFGKEVIEHKMSILIFSINFIQNISYSKTNLIRRLNVKYSLFLTNLIKFYFLDRFSKKSQILSFIKIRLVGAELFQADGWAERHDEANSVCSQFCKSTQKFSQCAFPGIQTNTHLVD